jgi:hypothetical protein
MQKEIDYNVIEQLISKKFEELKFDILKTISENNTAQLSTKLDSAMKAQNEFEEFFAQIQKLITT